MAPGPRFSLRTLSRRRFLAAIAGGAGATASARWGPDLRPSHTPNQHRPNPRKTPSDSPAPAEINGVLMQAFHWYIPADGGHWRRLQQQAPALAQAGITALWLPPAGKGLAGSQDVGYGIYDPFDLGEFDQRGTVATKYGTRAEYLAATGACRAAGIQVIADAVFNHLMGADAEEDFNATPHDPHNRFHAMGEQRRIRGWTHYSYPARAGAHSAMQWHWWHFDAVDYNSLEPGLQAVWRIEGKAFDDDVDLERGNYDYLMGCDLDIDHPEVRDALKHWGTWMLDTVGVDGFRLDAIKHISGDFFPDWIAHVESHAGRELFVVGEYWTYNLDTLLWYASRTNGHVHLFDAPLHHNFHLASRAGSSYDLGRLLDGTLMRHLPQLAVTLVENHDTQPLQALESVVEPWFKPLAYAFILLRREGYPCVFLPDYEGAQYRDRGRDGQQHDVNLVSHRWILDRLLAARRDHAYGEQRDWLDHPNCIGWTRAGSPAHPSGLAVLMSNGDEGSKWMATGKANASFTDITEHRSEVIRTNEHGWAEFRCPAGSLSVWVETAA
jgi:alpha-amylase